MPKQLTHRLVVPDGGDLRAEHDGGEEGEEEPLEDEEEEEDDGGGRREGAALVPLVAQARQEVVDRQEQRVHRHQRDVHLQQSADNRFDMSDRDWFLGSFLHQVRPQIPVSAFHATYQCSPPPPQCGRT